MQKIIPFLWFDGQAEAAAKLYTAIFENSKLGSISRYGEGSPGPKGQVMTVAFQLAGQEFTALNGGPEYHFTPAISFFVICQSEAEVDRLWEKLSEGGQVLMELAEYPFSPKFGWVNDRFGVSWQLNFANFPQRISPFLMFTGEQAGKAEEAIDKYISLFDDSSINAIARYSQGEGDTVGAVKHASFLLHGQEFMAMDSSYPHGFTFTPATSFFVNCEDQEEVDYFWEKLTEGGKPGPCGWLEDRYGVSWQIVPTVLGELMGDPDVEKARRVTEAMLKMGKLEVEKLKRAYRGG